MSAAKKKGKKGKGQEDEKSYKLLGRPGNHLKMGLVGLPNVGKSTTFNALTKMEVPASNFPFCTIEPNLSRCAVPDERFEWLADHHNPGSRVPAYLQVTDIAGLVKGAHEGQGLGNNFLSHISAVDGIFHVIRAFSDEDVTHVEGALDPVRDLEIISEELLMKDIEQMEGVAEKAERNSRSSKDKRLLDEAAFSAKILSVVKDQRRQVRFEEWSGKEIEYLNTLQLLTAKPVVILVNLSEKAYLKKKNKWLKPIFEWVQANCPGEKIIPFSADLETKLLGMDDAGREAWKEETGGVSGLDKIILSGYDALNLHHYFTAGEKEVKCWTLRRGTKAPAAAGVIHTDFEKGFICAEIMAFDNYKEAGSESACKAAGNYQQKGKEYVVVDGDIILFKFNPPKASKK